METVRVQFYISEGRIQLGPARYCIRFPKQSYAPVMCALKVRYLLSGQQDWTFRLTAQCYTSEDKLLWEDHRDWLITSQTHGAVYIVGVGGWTVASGHLSLRHSH